MPRGLDLILYKFRRSKDALCPELVLTIIRNLCQRTAKCSIEKEMIKTNWNRWVIFFYIIMVCKQAGQTSNLFEAGRVKIYSVSLFLLVFYSFLFFFFFFLWNACKFLEKIVTIIKRTRILWSVRLIMRKLGDKVVCLHRGVNFTLWSRRWGKMIIEKCHFRAAQRYLCITEQMIKNYCVLYIGTRPFPADLTPGIWNKLSPFKFATFEILSPLSRICRILRQWRSTGKPLNLADG